MPINVAPLPALKNVCIGYNDGGFSYLPLPVAEGEDDDNEPGGGTTIIACCDAPFRFLFAIQQLRRSLPRH